METRRSSRPPLLAPPPLLSLPQLPGNALLGHTGLSPDARHQTCRCHFVATASLTCLCGWLATPVVALEGRLRTRETICGHLLIEIMENGVDPPPLQVLLKGFKKDDCLALP